jgi:hypothetical protein
MSETELVPVDGPAPALPVEAQVVAQIEVARDALARARSFGQVKQVADGAAAIVEWLRRQQSVSLEVSNDARLLGLEAERRMGEFLKQPGAVAGDGRPKKPSGSLTVSPPTLNELGLNREAARVYRQVATVPVETMRDLAQKATAAGQELTQAAVLKAARSGLASVHFSSDSDEWHTPPEIIERVLATLGAIDLDPCSNWYGEPNVPAAQHYSALEDGLQREWHGRVYMNPPYGHVIDQWVEKLVGEFYAGRTTAAVALTPARCDTTWMGRFREFPRCYVRGRLQFSGHENSAPFPSCVVYLGPDLDAFGRAFHDLGDIYERIRRWD